MWHRFKNLVISLKTYNALSPDLKVRRQVNQMLRQRPLMSCDQWFESFCHPQGIPYSVASFAYKSLSNYSGLEFGRVLPTDRLDEDLHWTQVCWFDWELSLYNDFQQQFGVDISDCLDEPSLDTIKDLLLFLNQFTTQNYEPKP